MASGGCHIDARSVWTTVEAIQVIDEIICYIKLPVSTANIAHLFGKPINPPIYLYGGVNAHLHVEALSSP